MTDLLPRWERVFEGLTEGRRCRISLAADDQIEAGDAPDLVRLPHHPPYAAAGVDGAQWYRLALLHRAAHYEFGTFTFALDQLPGLLLVAGAEPDGDGRNQHEHESDLEYVFAHLAERRLAERIFMDLEDLRVEARMRRRYGGVRAQLVSVHQAELALRPRWEGSDPRSAAVELLCRASLAWDLAGTEVPTLVAPCARIIHAATRDLARQDASCADTVGWTIRLYREILRLPRVALEDAGVVLVGDSAGAQPRLDPVDWEPRVTLEGQDELATALAPLPRYRDGLGFRHRAQTSVGRLESASIFRFIGGGTGAADDDAIEVTARGAADDEDRPRRPEPGEHEHFELVHHHYHPPRGRLSSSTGRSFLYPEWDERQAAYRAGWCRVREVRPPAAPESDVDERIFSRVARQYRTELMRLRQRTERLVHEGRKTVRRMKWGDDVDVDAAVEALVDLAAGRTPSPNIHIAREPVERDVALLALFDLSSSTAERVPLPGDDGEAVSTTRILDIELEAMALIMATFEATGDQLGIYGFSSSGRKDVQFVVLKDLTEKLSAGVTGRLDGVKPIHATRIGPAIRHATRKLRMSEARTRVLLLVSDGRPYDLDYAADGADFPDIEYAVADTRRALQEAHATGLRVKVLGIDHDEQDFVREICQPNVDFEMLPSVVALPQRMVSLYRDLSH